MTKENTKKVDFNETPDAKTYKVAVYGSLRKGLHNWKALEMEDEKYHGEFDSLPLYSLYAVTSSYPGIKLNGTTSVKMEVYEVGEDKLDDLNSLEGYYGPDAATNHYNRTSIDTPFGDAYLYVYNYNTKAGDLIESGDWKDHYETKQQIRRLTNQE